MSALSTVLARGTRAAQPAATAVPIGSLYYVTDEPHIVEQSTGSAWALWPGDRIVRKTANESVTTSDVLQDDDVLLMAVRANEVWQFEFHLRVTGGTGGDFKFDVTGPTAYTVLYTYEGFAADITVADGGERLSTGLNEGSGGATVGTMGTTHYVSIQGIMTIGANAGNLKLTWAQGTSNGTATTVAAGSYLKATRIV
jgi:hypothetical protein